MLKLDYVFQCKKCEHKLFVDIDKLKGLDSYDCPACGEQGYINWIYYGMGVFGGKKDSDSWCS